MTVGKSLCLTRRRAGLPTGSSRGGALNENLYQVRKDRLSRAMAGLGPATHDFAIPSKEVGDRRPSPGITRGRAGGSSLSLPGGPFPTFTTQTSGEAAHKSIGFYILGQVTQ